MRMLLIFLFHHVHVQTGLNIYPCKHFFAVFRFHSKWNWEALPQEYVSTPRMSLDTQALQSYFSPDSVPQHFQSSTFTEISGSELPKRKVSITIEIALKTIESLTYMQ